jgi:hypothetical protein
MMAHQIGAIVQVERMLDAAARERRRARLAWIAQLQAENAAITEHTKKKARVRDRQDDRRS